MSRIKLNRRHVFLMKQGEKIWEVKGDFFVYKPKRWFAREDHNLRRGEAESLAKELLSEFSSPSQKQNSESKFLGIFRIRERKILKERELEIYPVLICVQLDSKLKKDNLISFENSKHRDRILALNHKSLQTA